MPSHYVPFLRDRLSQLTDTLHQLKDRVREAVASEMGRVVAEAVRDLLSTALRGAVVVTPGRPPAARPHWADDEDDRWADDDRSLAARKPASTRVDWPATVAAAAAAARWLWRRRFAAWACLAAGVAAGLAALSGHPLVRVVLGTVATAAGVVDVTHFDPP